MISIPTIDRFYSGSAMRNRVVITGMGAVTPLGNTLSEFERGLRAGRSGVAYMPELEELGFRCCAAGKPAPVDHIIEKLVDTDDAADMDDTNRLGVVAAWKAWRDAGFENGDDRIDYDTGVIIGSDSPGVLKVLEKLPLVYAGKVKRIGARYGEQITLNGVASRAARLLGLGNRVSLVNTTSATGSTAIVDGFRHIRHGYADRMLCGAVQAPSPLSFASLDSMRVTNCNWKPPESASRPMSVQACGLVPSSGAGVVVLESLHSALQRNVKIYAEVLGAYTNCGAARNGGTMTAPSCDGVRQCILRAVGDAEIGFDQIDLINGHLTGTMADALEVRNWIDLFESEGVNLPYIHSTKSLIGHPLAAAGAIEIIACALMLRGGFVHPSINCDDPIPELSDYACMVPSHTIETDLDVIIKSSLGFGDVNAVTVLGKFE
jgi:3-oxoacyl-(acyl-carrier-protein) synthase